MKTTVIARPARPNDTPHLVAFICAMALESEQVQLNADTVSQGVRHIFHHPEDGRYWVLEDSSLETPELAGMCLMTYEWSDWHNRYYGWFQSVYLAPPYRGQGLLGILMNTIEATCQTEGIQELRLYVENLNHRAQKAYQRLGFELGHYQVMQKPLR